MTAASRQTLVRLVTRRPRLVLLLIDVGVAFGTTGAAWRDPRHRAVGDGGDATQAMWALRWFAHTLVHGGNALVTTHINAPDGINLMWNMSIPLPALLVSPVTLLAGPVVAYNLVITTSLALSAWTASLLLRRHVDGFAGPCLGGLVYGFSPYAVAQSLGHPNLSIVVLPPLFAMTFEEILLRRERTPQRCGVWLGLLAAGQLLVGEEVLAMVAIVFAAATAAALLLYPERLARAVRLATSLGSAAGVFAVISAAFLLVQFAGRQRVHGPFHSPDRFVTNLLNLVVPSDLLAAQPERAHEITLSYPLRDGSEIDGYLGIPLLLLVLICAWTYRRSRAARLILAVGVLAVVLSLGQHLQVGGDVTGIPLPWLVAAPVPLIQDILPERFVLFAFLCAAFAVAVAVRDWQRAPVSRRLPAAVLVGAVAVSLCPRLPMVSTPTPSVPDFFTGSAQDSIPASSVALLVPFPDAEEKRAQFWQAAGGMRFCMPGGYFFRPDAAGRPTSGPLASPMTDALSAISRGEPAPSIGAPERARLDTDMERWGVSSVILGPFAYEATARDFLARYLGRAPDATYGDVAVWWIHASATTC